MPEKENERSQVQSRSATDTVLNDRKPNILFFHNTLPEYRIGWFEELNKQSNITFIITSESVYKEKYGFDICEKYSFNCVFLKPGREGIKNVRKILKCISNYDLVELPPLDSPREILIGEIIIRAAKKKHVKTGFFWEKWEAPIDKQPFKRRIKNLILRLVPKSVYKNCDVIHAGSTNAAKYFISNGIDSKKIKIIPNCSLVPDCSYVNIRAKYHIPADVTLLLYFGRIIPEKGLNYLITALAILNKNSNKYFLLVAGEGDFKIKCIKQAEKLRVSNIVFVGAVKPENRKNYFEQSDIFIFPCTYYRGWVDVWGLTINEAIQFNKPVVSTYAVGSANDLIENGINGFKVKPGDSYAIAKAIILVKNLSYYQCYKFDTKLREKYNFKNMAKEIVQVAKK